MGTYLTNRDVRELCYCEKIEYAGQRLLKRGESKVLRKEKTKCERRCESAKEDGVREDVENNCDDSKLILLALISYCEQ